MAQTAQVLNSFTFVRGLVSEASPLTFPADASLDENNFVLKRDGSREKRLGIDYEEDFIERAATGFRDGAVASFVWRSVGGNGSKSFLVCQFGNNLEFFDVSSSSDAISGTKLSTTINLDTHAVGGVFSVPLEKIQFSSGNGLLFVTSSAIVPLNIEFDEDAGTVSATEIEMSFRDFEGVDDGLDVTARLFTLSKEHEYNLLNQSWGEIKTNRESGQDQRDIDIFRVNSDQGFPSNADIPNLAMVSDPQRSGRLVFDAEELKARYFGNTPAPQGKFILDFFVRDRSSVSGVNDLPIETITDAPRTSEFFAGRWFTALGPDIFFSQILKEKNEELGKFFQKADPTSDIDNELAATDGGVIHIQDCGEILKIVTASDGLLVLASNGVWFINGASDAFSATNFQVTFVSDRGISNPHSVVEVESTIIYMNDSGIYSIGVDKVSGRPSAVNISKETIQTIFLSISATARKHMTGFYDFADKKVYWLYNSDESFAGTTFKNKYDSLLVLDTVIQAWYKLSVEEITGNSPFIYSGFITPEAKFFSGDEIIVDSSGDTVITSEGVEVVLTAGVDNAEQISVSFLTATEQPDTTFLYTFSNFINSNFLDWETEDSVGQGYEAFLLTGYNTADDIMRHKQAPYIQAAFTRTEGRFVDNGSGGVGFDRPSSCLMETRWDWVDNSSTGKIDNEQELYRFTRPFIAGGINDIFDNGYPVTTTKTKVRGRGRALNMKFTSPAGKDCKLLGWAILLTGNTAP